MERNRRDRWLREGERTNFYLLGQQSPGSNFCSNLLHDFFFLLTALHPFSAAPCFSAWPILAPFYFSTLVWSSVWSAPGFSASPCSIANRNICSQGLHTQAAHTALSFTPAFLLTPMEPVLCRPVPAKVSNLRLLWWFDTACMPGTHESCPHPLWLQLGRREGENPWLCQVKPARFLCIYFHFPVKL